MFSVSGEKQWDREAQAAFKGVQLIKNRTDTQTQRKTPLPASAHTGTRPRTNRTAHRLTSAITTYCLQVELGWTGSDYTQQKEPPLQTC